MSEDGNTPLGRRLGLNIRLRPPMSILGDPLRVEYRPLEDPAWVAANHDICDKARKAAQRIALLQTGLPIVRLQFIETRDALSLCLTLRLVDRNDPTMTAEVKFTQENAWMCMMHDYDGVMVRVIEMVRNLLHSALKHEADEVFFVDGRRIFDPHVE